MARSIERVDFARTPSCTCARGVHADADQELVDGEKLRSMMGWSAAVVPFEGGGPRNTQRVGQALIISPDAGHLFWCDLMVHMVGRYNATSSVLLNAGPLAVTIIWNENFVDDVVMSPAGRRRSSWRDDDSVRLTRQLDGSMDAVHHMGPSRSITWVGRESVPITPRSSSLVKAEFDGPAAAATVARMESSRIPCVLWTPSVWSRISRGEIILTTYCFAG
jgi:hypothetical protein